MTPEQIQAHTELVIAHERLRQAERLKRLAYVQLQVKAQEFEAKLYGRDKPAFLRPQV